MAPPLPTPDAVAFTNTRDGLRLALHRYHGRAEPRGHAVVLCHGLGANHHAFDIHPDVSLARYLSRRGYEVFSVDLRGHGASERPAAYRWTFDDYLHSDVPALVAAATRLSGARPVHWIGHSMGGLLAYAHLASASAPGLRSAITVGSSLDYSVAKSGFRRLLPFRALLARLPAVPVRSIARLSSRFPTGVRSPFEAFNVWSSNVHPEHWQRVCEAVFHPVSPPVMEQLASAMEPGGLRSRDGRRAYFDGLASVRAPVLALAGDRDRQCPPEAARHTSEALGSASRQLAVFGKTHGHHDHYGHFDLVMGRRAPVEVFPIIAAWLDAHDAPNAELP